MGVGRARMYGTCGDIFPSLLLANANVVYTSKMEALHELSDFENNESEHTVIYTLPLLPTYTIHTIPEEYTVCRRTDAVWYETLRPNTCVVGLDTRETLIDLIRDVLTRRLAKGREVVVGDT